eukprot:2353744-Ditylum_brightwellii.AAC.1
MCVSINSHYLLHVLGAPSLSKDYWSIEPYMPQHRHNFHVNDKEDIDVMAEEKEHHNEDHESEDDGIFDLIVDQDDDTASDDEGGAIYDEEKEECVSNTRKDH